MNQYGSASYRDPSEPFVQPGNRSVAHIASTESGSLQSGSLRLRSATAEAHRQIEASIGVPGNIQDKDGYGRCLASFYTLYAPLERAMALVPGWTERGIDLSARRHAPRLLLDLQALAWSGCEVDPAGLEMAPEDILPDCASLSRALGVLYVLEGSTLGGRFILQELTSRLGDQIAGATAFFSGHGANTSSMWQSFRASVDRYAVEEPAGFEETIAGAIAAFEAIGLWMAGRCGTASFDLSNRQTAPVLPSALMAEKVPS